MTDIDKIISGLTRLQRDSLIDVRPIFDHDMPHVTVNLITKGLVDFKRRWGFFGARHLSITPLGLAVRARLQEQDNA